MNLKDISILVADDEPELRDLLYSTDDPKAKEWSEIPRRTSEVRSGNSVSLIY